jgi:AcrR family transcriptional regulator
MNASNSKSRGRIVRKHDRTVPRSRRTAADTRSAILTAAERRLVGGGPEAIRLQEIAADVGISHPAILHHFGSREGLVEAMVLQGIAGLQAQFLEGWPSDKVPDIEGVLERFYEVASRRGVARLLAWLILSGEGNRATKAGMMQPAAERMHRGRVRKAQNEGRPLPKLHDTQLVAALLAILVLGDALFGPSVRRAMGLGANADSTRHFRRWLIKFLERIEQRGAKPSASS